MKCNLIVAIVSPFKVFFPQKIGEFFHFPLCHSVNLQNTFFLLSGYYLIFFTFFFVVVDTKLASIMYSFPLHNNTSFIRGVSFLIQFIHKDIQSSSVSEFSNVKSLVTLSKFSPIFYIFTVYFIIIPSLFSPETASLLRW